MAASRLIASTSSLQGHIGAHGALASAGPYADRFSPPLWHEAVGLTARRFSAYVEISSVGAPTINERDVQSI